MKKMLCVVVTALLGACAATGPVALNTSFDPAEVAWFNQKGNNTIQGNAVMRTVGGEVRTCAGLKAGLTPRSKYADERAMAIYGSMEQGMSKGGVKFASTDPRYQENSRVVTCDAQGNFEFADVPDGEYYVSAVVTWGVPMGYGIVSSQGGAVMQHVKVSGGETKRIVLTN